MQELKIKKGFTLIEALVLIFLITVIVVTFYSVLSSGINGIIESKKILEATEVASEKMEVVRNLHYADIGTTTGIVHGILPEKEIISKNSGTFYIFTSVHYIDDPYDKTLIEDTTGMNDYKRVRIKATWEDDINSNKGVTLVSDFSPPGIESDAGGGLLGINVLDISDNMKGIKQADVHIINTVLGIDTHALTDDSGNILFPAAPAGDKNYAIDVFKEGYFSVRTYPPYPTSSFNPVNVDVSVLEDQSTMINLYTSKLSDLTIQTQDPFGVVVPNIRYKLEGGMKIGDTIAPFSIPVYVYSENLNSGSSGKNQLENMSAGVYTFTFNTISGYEFIKLNPISTDFTENNKFILLAGTNMTEKAIFVQEEINSLLITVVNDMDQEPIKEASVQLSISLPENSYDKTIITDDYGQAYFPDTLPELAAGSYNLKVTAEGFQDKNDTVDIRQLTKKNISLKVQL